VGVVPGAGSGAVPGGAAGGAAGGSPGRGAGAGRVAVRRTGGFAGLAAAGAVELDDDPRSDEVRSLLDRIDLASVRPGDPRPDMFVYDVDVDGQRAVVPEQHLTDDLRRLVDLVLGDRPGSP
jgi:hypothetical protein